MLLLCTPTADVPSPLTATRSPATSLRLTAMLKLPTKTRMPAAPSSNRVQRVTALDSMAMGVAFTLRSGRPMPSASTSSREARFPRMFSATARTQADGERPPRDSPVPAATSNNTLRNSRLFLTPRSAATGLETLGAAARALPRPRPAMNMFRTTQRLSRMLSGLSTL